MRAFPAMTVTAAACALAIAGCGSSSNKPRTIPQAQAIQKGDEICAAAATLRSRIRSPDFAPATANKSQLSQVAAYYNQLIPTYSSEIEALHALGTPDRAANMFEATIGNTESFQAALTAAREAASSGEERAFRGALNIAQRLSKSAQTAGQRFGFKVCGVHG